LYLLEVTVSREAAKFDEVDLAMLRLAIAQVDNGILTFAKVRN
jgi:hypothetical protein